jgi:hypothetical protein
VDALRDTGLDALRDTGLDALSETRHLSPLNIISPSVSASRSRCMARPLSMRIQTRAVSLCIEISMHSGIFECKNGQVSIHHSEISMNWILARSRCAARQISLRIEVWMG